MSKAKIAQEQIEECYPLTGLQEGMLFNSLFNPQSAANVEQLVCTLNERLDGAAFERALQRIIERHSVLRTKFRWKSLDDPLQEISRHIDFSLERSILHERTLQLQEEELNGYLRRERLRGFGVNEGPLVRFALFELSEEKSVFVWTFHQALLDNQSILIILKELFAFYDAFHQGRNLQLEDTRPFRDYVEWLREQDNSFAEEFWRTVLNGFTAPTPINVTRLSSNVPSSNADQYREQEIQLSSTTNIALCSFRQRYDINFQTLMLGAWSLLLSRYSNETDVVCGMTKPFRPQSLESSDAIVGLLVNTVPARVRVEPKQTVADWLKELQAQQSAQQHYENASLSSIQKWSDVPPGIPLFESLLIAEDYSTNGISIRDEEQDRYIDIQFFEQTNYPVTLFAYAEPEFRLKISYDENRFDCNTITRMLGHLKTLLESIARHNDRQISHLPLLTSSERHQLLIEWNDTERPYSKEICLHHLLEAQAERIPDKIAVQSEDEKLTYRELNERANRVARRLRALNVRAETRVGLLMDRSTDTFAALMGILKAGGAYVPLDPMHPKERLAFMLEDAQAPVLLTQTNLAQKLSAHTAKVVCLDRGWEATAQESTENLTRTQDDEAGSENLAYVIYTSGSTGKPKGVQIQHRAVINLLHSMRERPGLTEEDVLLAITTFSFDMAVPDIYLPLMVGARTELVSREIATDARRLLKKLEESEATVLQATPSTWRMLIEAGWKGSERLKALCGAEALTRELADELLTRSKELWNLYGPTETTVWSTAYKVEANDGHVTVGRPIANTQIYLLDAHLEPVPIGVAGELHIGGAGLARGYLNRPELTAERFIPNHLSDMPGGRLYKTGDAARYLPDGRIEYINRLDNQVKVRGFRIELGEIETRLRQHASVSEAVVIVRDDLPGGKTLVAYIVASVTANAGQEAAPTSSELREFLKETLPEYMIPSFFIWLDALPLTPNGKVNRRALPAPNQERGESEKTFVPPRDSLELQLANIWESVLNVRPVSVNDNFFESGGDSLLAVRLFIQVEEVFGKNLPLATLIQTPTVEGLANMLRGEMQTHSWSPLVPIQPEGSKPPFFCVHGVGGNVLNYRALANYLGTDQPFYGLQSQGLNGEQPPLTRIEEIAALYLKEVRRLQPKGPYYLGGASFGGVVAFEMARQLYEKGARTALVALFDTTPYGYTNLLPKATGTTHRNGLAHKLKVHLNVVVRDPDRITYLRKKIRRVRRKTIYRTWQIIYQIFQKLSRPLPQALQNVQQANYKALNDYTPDVYPGGVTLFCADQEPEEFTHDKQKGWKVLAAGGVTVYNVPGDHLTIIEDPHVRFLAEKLKACLS